MLDLVDTKRELFSEAVAICRPLSYNKTKTQLVDGVMQKKSILNNFKHILGQYCAISQFVELSKRCFTSEHAEDIANRDSFIALASQNSITLTNYDADAMVNAISRSYIVNVHLCFETFLKDICVHGRNSGRKQYIEKAQEESWLDCAVKNITDGKLPKDKHGLYYLCEYYRLVRNSAVHDLCDVEEHKLEYRKLQKYDFKTETKFAKLSAPNEYHRISFDDFVMFARSSLELATYLFEKISYDYEKIILDLPDKQKNIWKTYNQERCRNAILMYVKTLYAVDDSLDEQLPHLVDLIVAQ